MLLITLFTLGEGNKEITIIDKKPMRVRDTVSGADEVAIRCGDWNFPRLRQSELEARVYQHPSEQFFVSR
jgi:hypothetical protein